MIMCEPSAVIQIVVITIVLEVVLGGVLGFFIATWRPERENFEPSLVDLIKYEKNLLYQREHGKPPVPVQPIPNVGKGWSEAERQAMEDNRKEAERVLRRIFPGGGVD